MKKSVFIVLLALSSIFTVCAQDGGTGNTPQRGSVKIKITINDNKVLTATLIDNPTARAIIAKLPLTIPLTDLYAREMCYRFTDALPTDNVQTTGYEIGEIIYWPPRYSFVIMYAQNGERFSMQKIGRVDSGVEIFRQTGNVTVTLEAIN
jgi:hypothetical protein